jgi:hypothetical protein
MKFPILTLLIVFLLINCICTDNILFIKKNKYKVSLLVYSGTENPTFFIDSYDYSKIHYFLQLNKYKFKRTSRVMGYQGFLIENYENDSNFNLLRGNPDVELYLLEKIKQNLKENVYEHIFKNIFLNYELNYNLENIESYINKHRLFSGICDNIPLRGSDVVPLYDPSTDDSGCFIEKQWDNNCYNYGNDIVTNSFAQPGRGSSQKWIVNTCEDVTRAAISDGLKWIGTDYPKVKPEKGHYIALLIWPDTNFHWLRLDSSGFWSHKPGGSEVKNTDNEGKLISNPSNQDFSPWTQFCGYFLTIPSKVILN